MPVAAIVGAVGAIGGAAISSSGAKSAANTQAQAADTAAADNLQASQLASQTQLQMYNQTRSDLMPFSSTGASAMSQLASIFGFGPSGTGTPNASAATSALAQFPGYQFGMDQGVQALDRSAASRGLLLSGAQLKDTQQFGQNYAQQQAWQPYVSALQSASSLGENAAAITGNAGSTAATGSANALLAGGSAAGQAALAGGQAVAGGQVAQGNIGQNTLNVLTAPGGAVSQLASEYGSSYGPSGLAGPQYTGVDSGDPINGLF